jgi:hypothetical protein
MMNVLPVGLHKTILLFASDRAPHVPHSKLAAASTPVNFTNTMAQMMPPAPYHQMHYTGQLFGPTPPPVAQPSPPAPAPPAGTMMVPYYAPYPQPHSF